MIKRMHGRKKPYTEKGIKRTSCIKCGAQAAFQWQICSDDNIYRPLCASCDIDLNDLVLRWAGFDSPDKMIERYASRVYAK